MFLEIIQTDKNNTMMLATGTLKQNENKTLYPQTDSDQFYESRVLKETIKPAEGEGPDIERGPSFP